MNREELIKKLKEFYGIQFISVTVNDDYITLYHIRRQGICEQCKQPDKVLKMTIDNNNNNNLGPKLCNNCSKI